MKTDSLVLIPTYNEKENIEKIIRKVFSLATPFHVLIIDDGSPDGTASIVKNLQKEFSESIPRAKNGDSLADFQLNTRLFKNRCSYMIYSDAFRNLPTAVKSRVLTRLKTILDAPTCDNEFTSMKLSERRRIATILRDTGVL